MDTNEPHITIAAALRRALVLVAAALIVASGIVSTTRPSEAAPQQSTEPGYGWPVKPFNRPHPVRANFGDPRMVFHGPATLRTLLDGTGSFSFHFGIDIYAPDGTAVYPVRSGTAIVRHQVRMEVDSGAGFSAQYWHVRPVVADGQHVEAGKTVIGYVIPGHDHVHFTELENGKPVNPLAPGHIEPYVDTTQPTVSRISFRMSETGRDIPAEFLHGRVLLIAAAFDMPAERVPGEWGNLPVAPARLTWHIARADTGRTIVPEREAFDVRHTMPSNDDFWSYYARGSRQNMTGFGGRRFWLQPGEYLYKLQPQPFDTRTLHNGVYALVVTASDTGGNHASLRQVFTVHNDS